MDLREFARRRLAAQFLQAPLAVRTSEVVARLGAVQAQDYRGAKWALAQRTTGATDADVEHEVDVGSILRTHVLRPTWHFVTPADIRWMLALSAPRITRAMSPYNRHLELTPADFRRSNDALAKALAGGAQRTRAELSEVLAGARVGPARGQRLGHLMMQAELDGIVVSGAYRGTRGTYALLDERVPHAPPRDRDDAMRDLAVRYFATRGPATTQDFAWWSGLTVADARRAIDIAAGDLERVDVDERPHWMAAGATAPGRTRPVAHLLPNYDEFFIAYRDRGAIARRLGRLDAVTGANALLPHVAFIDGQLVGEWRRTERGSVTVIALRPMTRLTTAERSRLHREVERLGRFLGRPVEVRDAAQRTGGTRPT